MMESLSTKFLELFRNLKSDAVPRAPRQTNNCSDFTDATQEHDANDNHTENLEQPAQDDEYEEIVFGEDDFVKEEKKSKFGFPFKSKKNKDEFKGPKPPKKENGESFSSVNTQATGTVFNVINSNDVQFGSNHVYYLNGLQKQTKPKEEQIEKDNLIILLMESTIEPKHKFIDFIAKNLGENWQSFFITLGYLKGRMDTLVLEKGITEARYQLLIDWVNNADDATLGHLARILWEEGERQIVKHLSIIYKESKK